MKITTLSQVPVEHLGGPGVEYSSVDKQVPIGNADGVPNFSMRVFTLAPGGATPHHEHPWEHETYILGGSGVVVDSEGEEHAIGAGSFVYVPPGEMHQFRNASESDPFQFICLVPKERE